MQSSYFKKTKLPDKPGVYFFLKTSPRPSPERRGSPFPFQGKAGGEVLYIGKATSLKDRVKSYFGKDLIATRGPLIVDMVFRANKIDWRETESVLEALILEARLIKKHKPYYNTKEKDNKSFNVVCITREKFPRVLVFRERNLKSGVWQEEHNMKFQAEYGPFTNGAQLKDAMKIIRPIFPYLDAQSSKPDNFQFYRQIGLAPDIGTKEAQITYSRNIKNLKLFFEGKKKKVISNFKKEMMLYAKKGEFERANEIKKRIFALQHINDIALIKNSGNVFPPLLIKEGNEGRFLKNSPHPSPLLIKERGSSFRIEAYDIAHMGGKNMVGVMTVVEDGEVEKSEYKKFQIRTQTNTNDTAALDEVLSRRLNHPEWPYPNLIVVDGSTAQLNVAKHALMKIQAKILVVAVVKDERHKAKAIMGDKEYALKYKREILLANSEAHRFAIAYHKKMRNRNFLP